MWHPPYPIHPFWLLITRLGEAQIVLPAALVLCLWLAWRSRAVPLVPWWASLLTAAVLITAITKVAFLGWGIGSAALNFTGVSGHAMFAAAVIPLLMRLAASSAPPLWQNLAWVLGYVIAALVAVSRVMLFVHSLSEVIAGFALGGLASALTFYLARTRPAPAPVWLPLVLVAWLAYTPVNAPPSNTHGVVERLSLALSGRNQVYSRRDMLKAYQQGQHSPAATR